VGVPQDAIEDYIQDAGSCCYAIGTPLKIKKTCLPKYLETGITFSFAFLMAREIL